MQPDPAFNRTPIGGSPSSPAFGAGQLGPQPSSMRASMLPIVSVLLLHGCATNCTGPACVDQLGWFSKCYGHKPQEERIIASESFDDGTPSLVLVHTTFDKLGLPRETAAIGYDEGWPYAEQRMKEDGRCAAGFEPVMRRMGDRAIPVVTSSCSNVSYWFKCVPKH
jgi:hypothetical protein